MAIDHALRKLDDAIAEANRLPFGLAAYAFTKSVKTAHALTPRHRDRHDVDQPRGLPWAEMPFGGVKDSGYGSEGGTEAMEAYLNTKSVAVLNT